MANEYVESVQSLTQCI